MESTGDKGVAPEPYTRGTLATDGTGSTTVRSASEPAGQLGALDADLTIRKGIR